MVHVDLFSGIGGFAIATERVWKNVEHIFVDNDPFCQAVLKKHWPTAPIYGDIRTFASDTGGVGHVHGEPQKLPAEPELETQRQSSADIRASDVFILTGGFPCQPFSQAGRRKGTADDRHLWPEMARVIRAIRPRWVIAENVGGLITWNDGLVLENVCTDLEGAGYEVQPFVIPAVAVNAPHRRDRVWIVGHAKHDGRNGTEDGESNSTRSDRDTKGTNELRQPKGTDSIREELTNPINPRLEGRIETVRSKKGWNSNTRYGRSSISWNQDWYEVATRLCNVDDGLSNGLVRPRGWRNAAIKAGGNAIVPQVAERIMKAIAEL